MNSEKAMYLLNLLEEDKLTQNLIAQGDSRYILFNVNEPVDIFPKYSANLNEKLTSIAVSYLSIGCTFAEKQNYEQSIFPLEKGATILENVFSPTANRTKYSSYFILTSSLAFYAANQYSKSFILMKNIEVDTQISQILSCFLKRQFDELDKLLSEVFLSDELRKNKIAEFDDEEKANDTIYLLIFSKALASLIEFIYSGNDEWLNRTKDILNDLLELLAIDSEPSLWWVIRLFTIIVDGFHNNSLWAVIPPHFDSGNVNVKNYISTMAFQKNPVIELFHSQKIALPKVLDSKGAVVSLPTSSGKTRIAEISILESLTNNPECKVLYLAPFRSLAFEVEDTLSRVFEPLNIGVSQLYGGTQYSKIDEMLINESRVIIATAEKAKAILRSNSEIAKKNKACNN